MKKLFLAGFVIFLLFACGSGGGGDDKVTIDPIVDEAEDLGNFPSDAEVVKMEDFVVGGESVSGTDSQELEDTYNDTTDVSVTLPPDLGRRATVIPKVSMWMNGKIGALEVAADLKINRTLPLVVGPNYFCFVIESANGKKYRSIVIKITRLLAASATKYPASVGGVSFNMVQVNTETPVSFPRGESETADTVTTIYSIGETEVTVALFAAVYQWACDNGKFNKTNGTDPNYIGGIYCYHGTQQLITPELSEEYYRYNDSTGKFTAQSGYETFPVVYVTWYGAVMFCNWLSEIIYGADEVVYSGIDNTWLSSETTADYTKKGFRLPTANEWECAARWVGTSAGGRSDLISMGGYYWTPNDYVSGSTANFDEASISGQYAYHSENSDSELHNPKDKLKNQLGCYDMSGNAAEWCFTSGGSEIRVVAGGAFNSALDEVLVSTRENPEPNANTSTLYRGFRLARTEK